jgi:hypothetical protein
MVFGAECTVEWPRLTVDRGRTTNSGKQSGRAAPDTDISLACKGLCHPSSIGAPVRGTSCSNVRRVLSVAWRARACKSWGGAFRQASLAYGMTALSVLSVGRRPPADVGPMHLP